MVTTFGLLHLVPSAAAEPQLLQPEPVAGNPHTVWRARNGAWLLSYSDAPRPGDPDSLEANGKWYRVPGGSA